MIKRIVAGIIGLCLMVFLFAQCGMNSGVEVKTSIAKKGELVVTISATGTVRSNTESKLTTVAGGRISRILIKENEPVVRGQVLLELDSTGQALKDFKRLESLSSQGFATPQQVELAKEQWKNTFIAAPFNGTIAKKFSEVGEVLAAGMSAFLLADLNDMIMESNVDETDIGNIKTGQPVEVVLDAYKDSKLKGKVQFIARSSLDVKEKGITYQVKVKLDPSTLVLRLGMTGDIYIETAKVNNVLMIPYTAAGEDKGERYVFLVEKGMLKKAVVKTGLENYDNVEILSGLKEGDVVVESNISKLKEGQKVKITK